MWRSPARDRARTQRSRTRRRCSGSLPSPVTRGRHADLDQNDEADLQRARAADSLADDMHWSDKLSRFNGLMEGDIHGFLDMDAGFTRADKVSATWAFQGLFRDRPRCIGPWIPLRRDLWPTRSDLCLPMSGVSGE